MPRARTGWIGQDEQGRWYFRYQYTDSFGKRRNIRRLVKSESNAKSQLRKALNKHDSGGERSIDGERLKFSKLAELYAANKIFEAVYVGDRKVAGLRSYQSAELLLEILKAYFADKRVSTITHAEIEEFKLKRLRTPKSNDKERTIASVNRELELLRAILRFAKRQKWILSSPFEEGAPLISKADEIRRERVLSHDEERRLLDACMKIDKQGRQSRAHLRPLLIAALDTAMRRGELFKLQWKDVDLVGGTITITAMNSKTARARTVGITPRLRKELLRLWQPSPKRLELTVFGYDNEYSSIKRAFASACEDAKLLDFRFHDCRHTAITRMIAAGMPAMNVMKISGHTQQVTFARYVNPNEDSVRQAAAMLSSFNTQARKKRPAA
jgi:integrase